MRTVFLLRGKEYASHLRLYCTPKSYPRQVSESHSWLFLVQISPTSCFCKSWAAHGCLRNMASVFSCPCLLEQLAHLYRHHCCFPAWSWITSYRSQLCLSFWSHPAPLCHQRWLETIKSYWVWLIIWSIAAASDSTSLFRLGSTRLPLSPSQPVPKKYRPSRIESNHPNCGSGGRSTPPNSSQPTRY